MKNISYTLLLYAFIVFIGGVIGYIKAASQASLIMGFCFSLLILGSVVLMRFRFKLGFYGAFSLTMTLCSFFAYRFFLIQTFFPSGLMLLVSLLTIVRLLFTKNEQELIVSP